MKKIFLFLPALLLIQSCTTAPVPQTDWIDIPLSEHTYYPAERAYRTGEYLIPVAAGEALEFKVGMLEGDIISYTLEMDHSSPSDILLEFHGHTERTGDEPGTVMFYTSHTPGVEKGSLIAPFQGIHGWFIHNQSFEDTVVTLNIAGFYEELEQTY